MEFARDRSLCPGGAVTLVALPGVTDAATMRKISYWRYSAVNLKTLFAALACALLVFSMLGCGTTKHLQSITLAPASGGSGLFNVKGIGGDAPVGCDWELQQRENQGPYQRGHLVGCSGPTGQIVPPAPPSTGFLKLIFHGDGIHYCRPRLRLEQLHRNYPFQRLCLSVLPATFIILGLPLNALVAYACHSRN
jgi:hypothetical protein